MKMKLEELNPDWSFYGFSPIALTNQYWETHYIHNALEDYANEVIKKNET